MSQRDGEMVAIEAGELAAWVAGFDACMSVMARSTEKRRPEEGAALAPEAASCPRGKGLPHSQTTPPPDLDLSPT